MHTINLNWPQDADHLGELRSGDAVLLSGIIYTARDAAHKRLCELLDRGEEPPFPLDKSCIYYAGPTPAPPGRVIGSIGPTTSGRMDAYKERLLQAGMRLMIGKGSCMPALTRLCEEYHAAYLAAPGGVAALAASQVRLAQVVAWEDLGAEAVRRLEVRDMLLIVINDTHGRDYYRDGR